MSAPRKRHLGVVTFNNEKINVVAHDGVISFRKRYARKHAVKTIELSQILHVILRIEEAKRGQTFMPFTPC